MSLHYEWTLSLRLRPDVPAFFLDELRFHLGLAGQLPEDAELGIDRPCLVMEPDDALPGLMSVVPAWLARWSLTHGWIGQAREELSLHPWLNFYVQDGHAYAAEPGGSVEPMDDTAPPFTLRQTLDIDQG